MQYKVPKKILVYFQLCLTLPLEKQHELKPMSFPLQWTLLFVVVVILCGAIVGSEALPNPDPEPLADPFKKGGRRGGGGRCCRGGGGHYGRRRYGGYGGGKGKKFG